eukprot:4281713-Lingulodinium_polyedra.AAC.1
MQSEICLPKSRAGSCTERCEEEDPKRHPPNTDRTRSSLAGYSGCWARQFAPSLSTNTMRAAR